MNRGLEPGTRPRLFRVTALIGEGYGHDDNEGDAVGRRDRDGRSLHGTRLRDPGEQRDLMRAANIQAFWQGAFDMGLKEAMLETIDLDEHGDTAIETSRYALTADDGSVADHGTYIVIWKNDGGAWKLHEDSGTRVACHVASLPLRLAPASPPRRVRPQRRGQDDTVGAWFLR